MDKSVQLKGISVTPGARKAIEAAGGGIQRGRESVTVYITIVSKYTWGSNGKGGVLVNTVGVGRCHRRVVDIVYSQVKGWQ